MRLVKCKICGKKLKILVPTHLKSHNISKEEYLIRFPGSELFSESYRNIYKGKNNGFYGKTHSKETRKKLSVNGKKYFGERNPFYKGKQITEQNFTKHFYEIKSAKLRNREYHLDHIIPKHYGFLENIDPEIIGNYKNLRIVNHVINERKGCKCPKNVNKLLKEIKTCIQKENQNAF